MSIGALTGKITDVHIDTVKNPGEITVTANFVRYIEDDDASLNVTQQVTVERRYPTAGWLTRTQGSVRTDLINDVKAAYAKFAPLTIT